MECDCGFLWRVVDEYTGVLWCPLIPVGTRLEVDLIASYSAAQKPSLGELLQFALNRSNTAAGETYDLPQIKLFVGMP